VAKARSDGRRCVIVVPFAPSDSTWPTLAAASCTTVVGQRDPCVIVPSSRMYVCDSDDLGGAQRLAVMAVDFSKWSKRSFAAVVAPCGHHRELRAPQQRLTSRDVDEQRRGLAEALLLPGEAASDCSMAGAGSMLSTALLLRVPTLVPSDSHCLSHYGSDGPARVASMPRASARSTI
jgi:hypothetical protein